MCWCSKDRPVKMVAENDIIVYKILIKRDGVVRSPCYEFYWVYGKTYNISSEIKIDYCEWIDDDEITDLLKKEYHINAGFHSLKDIPNIDGNEITRHYKTYKSNRFIFGVKPEDILCKCIIPKGSIYYENEYGEIVSNKLKIVKQLY